MRYLAHEGPQARGSRLVWLVGALLALAGLALLVGTAEGFQEDLILISRANGADGAAGDEGSGRASIDNNNHVAFQSDANNLSSEDNDAVTNIFLRDVNNGTTVLVSRADGAAGPAADGLSRNPSISDDGRYVAFESIAKNLAPDDADTSYDVFVRDLVTNTTTLVSRPTGLGPSTSDSFNPSISSDGRFVAFDSRASYSGNDTNGTGRDVYVRDRQANTTTLVSRPSGPNTAASGQESKEPAISGDGNMVAFVSSADDLSTEDVDTVINAYVRNVSANTTTLVSRASGPAGAAADRNSGDVAISDDGKVAFETSAQNLGGPADTSLNVYMRDTVANTTTFVSVPAGTGGAGPAAPGSQNPSISPTGKYVAFDSDADNMSPEDNDLYFNVYVRNLEAGTTTFISRAEGADGAPGDNPSGDPVISDSAAYVAFTTTTHNLVPNPNGLDQVVRREINGDAKPPDVGPAIANFGVSPTKFAAAGSGASAIGARAKIGTTVRYTLDEIANVTFRVERASPGRRVGTKCKKPTRANRKKKKCVRYVKLKGSFAWLSNPGDNRFRFTGRLRSRKLKPGSYRLAGTPTNQDGKKGKTVRTKFKIVRR